MFASCMFHQVASPRVQPSPRKRALQQAGPKICSHPQHSAARGGSWPLLPGLTGV